MGSALVYDVQSKVTGARMNRSSLITDREVLVFLDRRQKVQYGSPEFFRQFGGSAEELHGKPFRHLIAPHLRETLNQHLNQLLAGTRDQFSRHIALLRRSASPLDAALTATALYGSSPDRAVVVQLARPVDEPSEAATGDGPSISEMAARVLEGTAAGLTTEFLAARLFVSRQTVEYHISRMLRQFETPNRVALIAHAYSTGMLRTNSWPPRVADERIK
ncbi:MULTISPECIES: LuxR C-terminal-related transcriptional regulator [unclassified Streptomyces]|uniref:helix-turn-helix transcriptional regulator n=1 Tax=unclassified Streptomyces TaxID=2593676 RepID=UPI003829D7E8